MNKGLITALFLITLSGYPWFGMKGSQTQQCESRSGRMDSTTVPSGIYGKAVAVAIYLPPCYHNDRSIAYPVIYLLHGGTSDETQWPDLNVQRSADALIDRGTPPFVVIMPGATYYEKIDYGAFVIKDLLPGIESQYRVQASRAGRAIGGLSLGGYWALKIAFLHPDLFAAVGGFSPVVDRGHPDDPLPLARQIGAQMLRDLKITLDVGNQDSLLYDTRELDRVLRLRGFSVSLTTGPGRHVREYWRARTFDYFTYFLNTLSPTL